MLCVMNYSETRRSALKAAGTQPWEENSKTVKLLSTTNIGLADTHLINSTAKEFNVDIQKKFDKSKSQKQGGNEQLSTERSAAEAPNATEGAGKKKKMTQQEHDKRMKEQNFRDHLFEMSKGLDTLNKMPQSSEYGKEFVFDKNMQDLCNTVNFDTHLLKNDLNFYAEAYAKCKATMRK